MLRSPCPCDLDDICPYNSESNGTCEYWCGETEEDDEEWQDELLNDLS